MKKCLSLNCVGNQSIKLSMFTIRKCIDDFYFYWQYNNFVLFWSNVLVPLVPITKYIEFEEEMMSRKLKLLFEFMIVS